MSGSSIALVSAGTLGDHLPMVVLAQALAARGHTVRFGCNKAMHGLCRESGIEPFPVGPPLGPGEARRDAVSWDVRHQPDVDAVQGKTLAARYAQMAKEIVEGCRDTDLLIAAHTAWQPAEVAAEHMGLPWGLAAIPPFVLNPPDPARPVTPEVARRREAKLRQHLLQVRRLRDVYGLPDLPDELLTWPRPLQALLASSQHFSEPRGPLTERTVATGFWFAATDLAFEPDDGLRAFLDDGPAPLVLSFSSLPLVDPAEVLEMHVRAAAKLGMRLVVQRGWADFGEPDSDQVYVAGHVPHDWLFARAAAVITHGGIGSIAQAIRARCPILVEPHGNDQFFNAFQVQTLRIGAAVRPRDASAVVIAEMLRAKVLPARGEVHAFADLVAGEQGVTAAVRHVEALLSDESPYRSRSEPFVVAASAWRPTDQTEDGRQFPVSAHPRHADAPDVHEVSVTRSKPVTPQPTSIQVPGAGRSSWRPGPRSRYR